MLAFGRPLFRLLHAEKGLHAAKEIADVCKQNTLQPPRANTKEADLATERERQLGTARANQTTGAWPIAERQIGHRK